MIVHPAKHLFEAKFPELEDHEEEIFFHHPVQEIKCNQLGVLYMDESEYFIQSSKGRDVIRRAEGSGEERKYCLSATKQRIVLECYIGKLTKKGSHLFHINGNPLDCRKENLKLQTDMTPKEIKAASLAKKQFAIASAEHLIELEKRLEERGVDPDDLGELLGLPRWLTGQRNKILGKMGKTAKQKNRITQEEKERVLKLGREGVRMSEIARRLEYKDISRIRYIFVEAGLPTRPKKVIK